MARRIKKEVPLQALAYIRMSQDEQTLSPQAQRSSIMEFAARKGIAIIGWYEDLGMSGGLDIDERPGLLGAITAVNGIKGAALLVAKHDRLARDEYTAAMTYRLVERAGGKVLSADGVGNDSTPESQLLRSIVAAFAAYERSLIRFRTRAGLKVKAKRGEQVGQIPYGFERAGQVGFKKDHKTPVFAVAPNKAEQYVIERIRKWSVDGESYRAIADRLNVEGTSARGSRWHVTTVRRIVVREAA